MPDYNTPGLKALHYSEDGTAWNVICDNGDVKTDTDLGLEAIKTETANSAYQSGSSANPTFHILDFSNMETIENFAIGANRKRLYFAMEFFDGRIKKTTQAVHPIVTDPDQANRRESDSAWLLELELHADKPWERDTSL